MPRILRRTVMVGAAALLVSLWTGAAEAAGSATPTLVRIQTQRDGQPVEGTGVVVGNDLRGAVFVLTAAPLFRRANGEPSAEPVRVELGDLATTVGPDRVLRPRGELSGIALLRVDLKDLGGSRADVQTLPVDYQEPALGGVFVVAVVSPAGSRLDVPERVQFGATRLVVGDRALTGLPACLGAPALTPAGVFGVVVDCVAARAPVVALASSARGFLMRHLPAAAVTTALRPPAFTLSERLLEGPLLTVSCNDVATGEVEVPFVLAGNERPLDASVSLLDRTAIRLGEATVARLEDRAVQVRFTLVGVPPPHFARLGNCARGQALVSVRLNVVTVAGGTEVTSW